MPTQRLRRLTRTEDQEYCTRLSRLEELGIPVGCAVDPVDEPDRLTLEQTEDELPTIYELPAGEVAVIVPAKLTVRKSGILLAAVAMMTPWEAWPLDLWEDPEDSPYYKELIGALYHQPPTILNDWLTRGLPLRPRQVEGVIIAHGYASVPRACQDETLVTVQLLLEDERRNELSFEFGVRMDRSVMRKCERQQQERREFARSTEGRGLFQPRGGQLRDQKNVSPEDAIKQIRVSGGHDTIGDAKNSGNQTRRANPGAPG